MTKREAEEAGRKVGHYIGRLFIQMAYVWILWFLLRMESWSGLSLSWGAMLFIAMLTISRTQPDDRPRVRGIPFDKSLH